MSTLVDVTRAMRLAAFAHRGQSDKAGRPYFEHPAQVAAAMGADDLVGQAVAWLHDVVEDSDTPLELIGTEFGDEVAAAVDAITHRPSEPNALYYERVRGNPIALRVKARDIDSNTDPLRTRLLNPEVRGRLDVKYTQARQALGLEHPIHPVPAGRVLVDIGDIAQVDDPILGLVDVIIIDGDGVLTAPQAILLTGPDRGREHEPCLLSSHGDGHLSLPYQFTVTDPVPARAPTGEGQSSAAARRRF